MEDPCKPQGQTRTRSQNERCLGEPEKLAFRQVPSHDVSPFKLSEIMFKGAL